MSVLLSYLAPRVVTPALLRTAIATGDILVNKYQALMPDDVRVAWTETLRPALERWQANLER
jgi:hypothetical protein